MKTWNEQRRPPLLRPFIARARLKIASYVSGCTVIALFTLGTLCRAEVQSNGTETFQLRPGPWGEVKAQTIKIAPSLALLDQMIPADETTVWTLEGRTQHEIAQKLRTAGFREPTIQRLLLPERARADGRRWKLYPSQDAILSLTPPQREAFYRPMRSLTAVTNSYLRNPSTIETNDPVSWFTGIGLSPKTIDLAAQVCHPQGSSMVLSDVAFVLSQIQAEEEKAAFRRAVRQTLAVNLQLLLTSETDVHELATYWSSPETQPRVLALLESRQPRDGETWLDITEVLPSMPRSRVNTFPTSTDLLSNRPDCRWTCLNFFADLPSDRFADPRTAVDRLNMFYYEVEPPYRFGDVIMIFEEPSGDFIHSCTYIADDIVFTKNGKAATRPWILQRDRHLSRIYVKDKKVRMKGYRRRSHDL